MFSKPNAVPVRRSDRETTHMTQPHSLVIQPLGRQVVSETSNRLNLICIAAWSCCIWNYNLRKWPDTWAWDRLYDEKEEANVRHRPTILISCVTTPKSTAAENKRDCGHKLRRYDVVIGCELDTLLNLILADDILKYLVKQDRNTLLLRQDETESTTYGKLE